MSKFILQADCGFSAGVETSGYGVLTRAALLIVLPPGKGDLKFCLALTRNDPEIAFGGQRRAELHFDLLGAMGHPADRMLNVGRGAPNRAKWRAGYGSAWRILLGSARAPAAVSSANCQAIRRPTPQPLQITVTPTRIGWCGREMDPSLAPGWRVTSHLTEPPYRVWRWPQSNSARSTGRSSSPFSVSKYSARGGCCS